MDLTRRALLAVGPSLLAARLPAQPPAKSRLILLGTKGGPTPSRSRAPAAYLLIVAGKPYVIDTPDGVARQLVLAGADLTTLGDIFITHHHSDHNAGLGSLLSLAWGAGLKSPVNVHGPAPLKRLLRGHFEAASYDIEARVSEEGRPPLPSLVAAHEYAGGETIVRRPDLKVTCVAADHYTVPDLAFRFDAADRSFVFSGDTTVSDRLIALARGADILVHEVMLLSAIDRLTDGNAPTLRDHLLKSHTTSEQLGKIAADAGVKTLVLSHLVPAFADITDEMWSAGVRKYFDGQIIVGRDLMEI